jgi:hypothetical protein
MNLDHYVKKILIYIEQNLTKHFVTAAINFYHHQILFVLNLIYIEKIY